MEEDGARCDGVEDADDGNTDDDDDDTQSLPHGVDSLRFSLSHILVLLLLLLTDFRFARLDKPLLLSRFFAALLPHAGSSPRSSGCICRNHGSIGGISSIVSVDCIVAASSLSIADRSV